MMKALAMAQVDGNSLRLATFEDVVARDQPIKLADAARERMLRSRAVVERLVATNATVYGVTTGFGLLADRHIGGDQLRTLQLNLVRSHACGVGDLLSERETRGLMLLRANVLAKGYSGVRSAVAELLCEMLNRPVHP